MAPLLTQSQYIKLDVPHFQVCSEETDYMFPAHVHNRLKGASGRWTEGHPEATALPLLPAAMDTQQVAVPLGQHWLWSSPLVISLPCWRQREIAPKYFAYNPTVSKGIFYKHHQPEM